MRRVSRSASARRRLISRLISWRKRDVLSLQVVSISVGGEVRKEATATSYASTSMSVHASLIVTVRVTTSLSMVVPGVVGGGGGGDTGGGEESV